MRLGSVIDTVVALESPSTAKVIEHYVEWSKAKGIKVWDEDGNEYLDLTAGSGVHCAGHGHPKILEAITRQLQYVTHTGWQFPTRTRADLLSRLCDVVPFRNPRFIFTVTGSEAVEASLKVARLAKKRPVVLSFQGGFHGKTGGSLAVTADPRLRSGVTNLPPDVIRLPFPEDPQLRKQADSAYPSVEEYIAWIERFIVHPDFPLDQVAGIIVEPVQGSSGMTAAPEGFLTALRELTLRHDLLLIVDEIYTGLGRTGRWFGFQHESIVPDIIIMGKALGGGLPLSLIVAEDEVMAHIPPYKQTSTFSGHPVACAAGLAVLDIIEEEKLLDNVKLREQQLRDCLNQVGSTLLSSTGTRLLVTGKGLMLGVRFESDNIEKSRCIAESIHQTLLKNKVLALLGGTYNNVIKITPPLNLTAKEVELISIRFETAIRETLEQGMLI